MNNIEKKRLGRAVREMREYRGQSRLYLCHEAVISNSFLCEIENGLKIPSVQILKRFAQIFNCRLWQLIKLSDLISLSEDPKSSVRNIVQICAVLREVTIKTPKK
jgi:transcriptional regulator with XRE-family HTH domain